MPHPSDSLLEQDAILRQAYHNLVQSDARPSELRAAEQSIVANSAAISAAIANGAQNCPRCDAPAAGRKKTDAVIDRGRGLSAVYEIGCSGNCGLRQRAPTPELAVRDWNKLGPPAADEEKPAGPTGE